ncbi:pseudouridine synthase [Methylobacterium sp. Leaf465]|uniref:pseudouridine synthase n=1 Tax=Methylobacterium sp. Leaf465 TaxID=1736385 RepID=UPI0012E37462|nr:pseudouridine synthase [Methylobacterium sp. Leaf465]
MPRGGDAPLRRRTAMATTAVAKAAQPGTAAAASGGPARDEGTPEGDRIAKAIARAGIASRRDAEAMIEQGRVTLNGRVLTSPAMNVTPDDRITVDGEPLPARERTRLWIYHKPRGLVTTARDPEGRQTVFDNLPEDLPRVVAIGRLDINTEGLLLLTNDGGLAKVVAHPDTGWLRRYRVRAHGDTTQAELDKLRRGVTIDGMDYGPVEATLDRASGDNLWITLGLREGKNREVKRILEHLGLAVNRLIRLSFGPFQLGDLEAGLAEEIRTKVLKEQLGPALSEQAGVDFESPVREPIAPFGSPKQQAKQPARSASAAQRRDTRGTDDEGPRGGGRPMAPAKPARVPTGGNSAGPRRSVWRAEDEAKTEDGTRRVKIPRRGADPKVERETAAARGRERVGAISTGERRVLVERLKSSPQEPAAEPHRRDSAVRRRGDEAAPREGRFPRAEAQGRPFRQADDRASESRPAGDRPARGFGSEGRPPRRDDDRPRGNFRSQDGAERRGPPRGSEDRPRGPFRGNANRAEGGDDRGARPASRGAPARDDRRDGFRGDKPSGFRGNDRPGGDRGGFKGTRPDGERGGYKGTRPDGDRGSFKGTRPDGERSGFKGAGKPGGGFKAGGKPGGFSKPGGKPGGFSRGGSGGGKPGGARPPRGGSR